MSQRDHTTAGDCILHGDHKEAAYRRLDEKMRATHVMVRECRECGCRWSLELDGGRGGMDLSRETWGDTPVDEILRAHGVSQ